MSKRRDEALILAIKTLGQYADPGSYHAVVILSDPPTGWFVTDMSYSKRYRRQMPGKQARQTLMAIKKLIHV